MDPRIQQFVDLIQTQWQAAQEPLLQLWNGSFHITVAALAAGGLFVFLLLVGYLRRGHRARTQALVLASNTETLRKLRQDFAEESHARGCDRTNFEQQISDAQQAAQDAVEQNKRSADSAIAAAKNDASNRIAALTTQHENEVKALKAANVQALSTEREHHRIELGQLKTHSSDSTELRSKYDALLTDNSKLAAAKIELEETVRRLQSAGNPNDDLVREREDLRHQLSQLLSAPVGDANLGQLDSVSDLINQAIELYASRNQNGALLALSDACALIEQMKSPV